MIGWKKLLSPLLAAALSLSLSPFALAAEEEEEKIPGPELPGLQDLREAGYDGSGIVIAVLDSGLRTTHEAFAGEGPEDPVLTEEDIESWTADGGTEGVYLSSRIPFAYDYCGRDDDVTTGDLHGTHVTALAAGQSETFSGAAPGAQILSMKVFPDNAAAGADDSAVLRALEDALALGADVVNLSLGMSGGFTWDSTLGGLYCEAFQKLRDAGVLLFCAAGNDGCAPMRKTWGVPLPTTAYTDYGQLCAPGTYLGTLPVAAAGWAEDGGSVSPAFYSSWGATSDLRLVPALTAPGSGILSAGTEADDFYIREDGTSMSSAYAAGAAAVLLQALRERGVTDKVQAADLAESLLECTAQVLSTAEGVPYSPRQQGCGLMDLRAALESPLAVSQPRLELGDSEKGRFVLTLALENLTEEDLTVSLETAVLTGRAGQKDGVRYSRLAPLDITEAAAVSGDEAVTVPAGGGAEAELTLEVDRDLREELSDIFPNGFFVEGFVTARTGADQAVHAAFLGFCGDWGAAPILEPADFRDALNARAAWNGEGEYDELTALNPELGINTAYISPYSGIPEDALLLGENPAGAFPHSDSRSTLPNGDTDALCTAGDRLYMEVYTLRNAAGLVMVVSDADTGEIYLVQDRSWLSKSNGDSLTGDLAPSARFTWDGGSVSGPLPDGTRARVDFYAWLDWDEDICAAYAEAAPHQAILDTYKWLLEEEWDGCRAWSFPVAIDNSAPSVSFLEEGGKRSVQIQDGGFLAWASVKDGAGRVLAEGTFAPEAAGEAFTLSLAGADLPETVYVTAADYASNTTGYAVETASGEAERCAMALLEDVDLAALYHEAVDFVWETGLMRGSEALRFRPQESATRAQVITALYRAAGSPAARGDLPFQDVPSGAWYRDALLWAWSEGIAGGYAPGFFNAPANVTREQLAVLLYRFACRTGRAEAVEAESWSAPALDWCREAGVLSGDADWRGYASRAETACALAEALGWSVEKS